MATHIKLKIMNLKENFGIKVTKSGEGVEIIKWFKNNNFDTGGNRGTAVIEEVYYIDRDQRLKHTSVKNPAGIEVYTLDKVLNYKPFPEKWACKGGEELISFFRDYQFKYKNYVNVHGNVKNGYYFLYEAIDDVLSISQCGEIPEGYTEVTVEQLREHYLKEKTMKKIIGYKAPQNLYGDAIKKGEIYKICFNKNFYEPSSIEDDSLELPKEIVETWEPVYEQEDKKLVLGSNNVEVVVGKDKITFKGLTTNVSIIKEIVDFYTEVTDITVSEEGYGVYSNKDVRFIRIGCEQQNNLFSINELENLLIEYKKLN